MEQPLLVPLASRKMPRGQEQGQEPGKMHARYRGSHNVGPMV